MSFLSWVHIFWWLHVFLFVLPFGLLVSTVHDVFGVCFKCFLWIERRILLGCFRCFCWLREGFLLVPRVVFGVFSTCVRRFFQGLSKVLVGLIYFIMTVLCGA